ncbi:class I SAM-dependent methyltransferase [Kiloniella antarctica]|uniref:Class I SAM-dependent methyltransferase n=1 Tax=Kiloniella antarctica TaxID=1550907 RepID=A0ABW5BMX7_9PROT
MKTDEYKQITNSTGYVSACPLPSPEMLARFYSEIYYQESATKTYQATYSNEELDQKRLRAKLLLHAVKAAQTEKKCNDFLEVGCGEGFVLQAAKEIGFNVAGIDFSSFGIQSFHPHLEEYLSTGDAFELLDNRYDSGTKVDVCILQNILEHVIDPEGLMQRIKAVLTPGGVAAINVPNDFSRMQEKLKDLDYVNQDYWFLPPQHLHYFNVDNIRPFMAKLGFEIVDMFGDFPIEMFLFHPGSNYASKPENGPAAHDARLIVDLLLAERGIENYYRFCQAMSACGIGRNVCVIVRPK